MKKKIIGIGIGIVTLVALAVFGFVFMQEKTQITETVGNKLDVSWYNEKDAEFVITTADQLYELAALSNYYDFKDQTIKLGADIVVNEGNAENWVKEVPARKWRPIDGFGGTFDGQGYTISGLYATGFDTPVALFTNTMSGCTIRDFKLVNTYFETAGFGGTASIASNGGGNFEKIYSNAILNVTGEYSGYVGGLFSSFRLQATAEECWYDGKITTTGRTAGGILDAVEGGRVTLKHCLFSGSINGSWDYSGSRIGGLVGMVYKEGAALVVEDTLISGTVESAMPYYTGAVAGVVYGNTSCTTTAAYSSSLISFSVIGMSGEQGRFAGFPLSLRIQDLTGKEAYKWTNLDFDNYWTVVEEETPILRCFATETVDTSGIAKVFDTSWYNETDKEFVLMDLADLYGFYVLSSGNTFEGKTVKLGTDIVVNEGTIKDWKKVEPANSWYPISTFAGTFDGQGHTISGIYSKGPQAQGLFAKATGTAKICNLKIKNTYLENTSTADMFVASVVGRGGGTIDSVYSDATIVCYGKQSGGIGGQFNAVAKNTISNCWFDGEIILKGAEGRYAGGILGTAVKGATTIINCLNTANVTAEIDDKGANVGGIVACVMNPDTTLNVESCLNVGKVSAGTRWAVGSVIGNVSDGFANIKSTYATSESCIVMDMITMVGNINPTATVTGNVMDYPTDDLRGTNAFKITDFDYTKYWALQKQSTPVLKTFATSSLSTAGLKRLFNTSWYKESAKTYTLNSMEDLYGFYILSGQTDFAGKTVKLGKDIVVNSGNAAEWATNAPANKWYPIKNFAGTFDGQGHTISGLYLKTSARQVGFFANTVETSVVKNMKIVNSLFHSTEQPFPQVGSIVGHGNGTFDTIYSEAILMSEGNYNGGIVGRITAKTNINNCWFNGTIQSTKQYLGGIVGVVNKGTATLTNCLNTGNIISTFQDGFTQSGGLVGATESDEATLVIRDSLSAGNVQTDKGGTGSVLGHAIRGKVTIANTYATKESCIKNNAAVSVGYKQVEINVNVITLGKSSLSGAGAFITQLDFDKYWVAKEDTTPELKSFATGATVSSAGAIKTDTSWYTKEGGTKTNPYIIKDAADLYGFAILSMDTNFKDKYIQLAADITVNAGDASTWATDAPSYAWIPIGRTKQFAGTFDGKGHTISGIYASDSDIFVGLFGYTTKDATIKNFKITNSYFESIGQKYPQIGSVAGVGHGTFDTIYSDAIIYSEGTYSAGLIGRVADDMTINNCWFDGSLKTTGRYFGGIVGVVNKGSAEIRNCLNTGTCVSTNTDGFTQAGGICGSTETPDAKLLMDGCLNVGKVETTQGGTGSILGHAIKGEATIKNTYATNESCVKNNAPVAIGYKQIVVEAQITLFAEQNLVGTKAFLAQLDYANYWVAKKDGTPELKSFATGNVISSEGAIVTDTSWYTESAGTKEDPYIIKDAGDLYGFTLLSQETDYAGKYIELAADITINQGEAATWADAAPDYVWIPVGRTKQFAGTFDGKGNTISGLYVSGSELFTGLFGYTTKASTIKNFKLTNSYFENKNQTYPQMGSIAGVGNGTFDSIYSDAIISSQGHYNAGIIGRITDKTTITNCWFAGTVSTTQQYVGGIVGTVNAGTVLIKNCLNTGTVKSQKTGAFAQAGGICAVTETANAALTIDSCLNIGKVETTQGGTGSILGHAIKGSATIINTYATNESCIKNGVATAVGYKQVTVNGAVTLYAENAIKGYNGFLMELDFANYWNAMKASTPVLKSFATGETISSEGAIVTDTSWYQESQGTQADPYIIKDAGDLYGLSKLAQTMTFAGKYIELAADIEVNKGDASTWKTSAPNYVWSQIGNGTTKFAGKFDGKGHSISGIYMNTDQNCIGFFGRVIAGFEIKNFSLKNSYFKTTHAYPQLGSIVGLCEGAGSIDTVYSNAIVESTGNYTGGIVGYVRTALTVNNCWYDGTLNVGGRYAGGIVGTVTTGTTTISNCLNSGVITSTITTNQYPHIGGICGAAESSGAVVNISHSLNVGKIKIQGFNVGAGNTVGAVFGRFAPGTSGTINCVYSDIDSFSISISTNTSGVITGTSTVINEAAFTKVAHANLLGALARYSTGLDFNNAWVARIGKTPALKSFVPESEWDTSIVANPIDTSWYDSNPSATTYTISTAAQLAGLAQKAQTVNFSGKTIKLAADITLNEGDAKTWATTAPKNTWNPIGRDVPFQGTFDGQGHTISGMYINGTVNRLGLFGHTAAGATIKNVRLVNSYVKSTVNQYPQVGSIVGQVGGSVENVYSDAIIDCFGNYCGGITGRTNAALTMNNCWFAGTIKTTGWAVGGIIGGIEGGSQTISNCLYTGDITSTFQNSWAAVGGICGFVNTANTSTLLKLEDCLSVGKLTASHTDGVGCVMGRARTPATLTDVYAVKDLTHANGAAFGTQSTVDGLGNWSTNGNTVTGKATLLSRDALLGNNARTNASGLNYNQYWSTVENGTPVLTTFK